MMRPRRLLPTALLSAIFMFLLTTMATQTFATPTNFTTNGDYQLGCQNFFPTMTADIGHFAPANLNFLPQTAGFYDDDGNFTQIGQMYAQNCNNDGDFGLLRTQNQITFNLNVRIPGACVATIFDFSNVNCEKMHACFMGADIGQCPSNAIKNSKKFRHADNHPAFS